MNITFKEFLAESRHLSQKDVDRLVGKDNPDAMRRYKEQNETMRQMHTRKRKPTQNEENEESFASMDDIVAAIQDAEENMSQAQDRREYSFYKDRAEKLSIQLSKMSHRR